MRTALRRTSFLVGGLALAFVLYIVTVLVLVFLGVIPPTLCTARDTSDNIAQCHER